MREEFKCALDLTKEKGKPGMGQGGAWGIFRAFHGQKRELKITDLVTFFSFQIVKNKGADQTARMRRLACAIVFRKQQSQGFS